MIIPYTLLAYEGNIEFAVKCRYGNIEAGNRFGGTVVVCDLILCRLQQLCTFLCCIICRAGEQIDDTITCK